MRLFPKWKLKPRFYQPKRISLQQLEDTLEDEKGLTERKRRWEQDLARQRKIGEEVRKRRLKEQQHAFRRAQKELKKYRIN